MSVSLRIIVTALISAAPWVCLKGTVLRNDRVPDSERNLAAAIAEDCFVDLRVIDDD